MAKTILPTGSYSYVPLSQQVDFTNFTFHTGMAFDFTRLLAIIDVTAGQLIYSTAGASAGYGGSYSSPILTLVYDTTAFTGSDLQIIYDLQNAPSATYDGTGTQPILSTTDPIYGREGLDINLLNSSFGGQLGHPLPSSTISGYNAALSTGFINGGNLVAPNMDPMTNNLKIDIDNFPISSTMPVSLNEVSGTAINIGQQFMPSSLPVVIASDQSPVDVNFPTGASITAINSANDVLGVGVTGQRNNQIEISFNSAPGPSLITNTFTGAGVTIVTNGHTIYSTSTAAISSAKGVSVQNTIYRPAHEIYSAFTAAFTGGDANSYQRIGLYDTNNGFFIGFEGSSGFGVTIRSGAADTFIPQASFNVDDLLGTSGSKFTRDGVPEPIQLGYSNLFRIRFAWLGSANIYYEVFSPDGEWVIFHNVRQPNTSFDPSIRNPNLPMTVDVSKTAGSSVVSIATACWGAGTTSAYSPITETITDNTLAATSRNVIYGKTTGGGGGYVAVKVNPSGALTVENTQSGTASNNIAQYGGAATSLGQKAMTASIPVVIANDQSVVGQNLIAVNGTGITLGQKVSTLSLPVVLSSDQSTLNVTLPDLILIGAVAQTATVNNILQTPSGSAGTDVSGYRSGSTQVVSTGTAGTFIFEGSNDNTNWVAIPVYSQGLPNTSFINSAITATASSLIYSYPIITRYIRLRIASTITGGSIQAISRITQFSWSAPTQIVSQPTGSNLNAVVSQSTAANLLATVNIAASQTLATVTTVSAVTSAALASAQTTDISSAAINTTQTSANIATTNTQAATFAVYVTAISGASAAMDVEVQETLDGTNYFTVYTFERITATGQYYSPAIKLNGSGIRYVRTISGTTPSVTNSVNRISRSGGTETIRRFINRTIDQNTLNSTSSSFFCEGVEDFNLILRNTAQSTAATVALQFSMDNTNWFTSSTTVTSVNGISQAKATNEQWKFVRAIVTAAGTGITLGELTIGGHSA